MSEALPPSFNQPPLTPRNRDHNLGPTIFRLTVLSMTHSQVLTEGPEAKDSHIGAADGGWVAAPRKVLCVSQSIWGSEDKVPERRRAGGECRQS